MGTVVARRVGYFGSKATSGLCQALVAAMPPHDVLGSLTEEMSTFGEDLIQSLKKALHHMKGEGPAIVHAPICPREVRREAKLTRIQLAALMGMSPSGYR